MTTTQQSSTSAPKASSLKLFISYARPDLPIVKELYDHLHREGFSEIFWDQDLNPGSHWSQVLTKTLKDADVVLVCISRQSIASPSVANEINLSRMSTKDQLLIPIRLDDSPVPVSLQSIQWLDLLSSMSLSEKEARYNILVKALLRFEAEKNNESAQVNVVSGYSDPSTGSDSVTTMEILPGMRLGLDPKDATNRTVVNDRAKEHITDDRLNFVPYVKALHEFIKAPETTTPLAISINGLWGTGKSSLMGMLMQEIEPEQRKRWHMHWQGLAWHVGRRKPLSTLWLSRLLLRLGGISERRHQNAMLALIAQRKRMPSPYYPTVWFNAWKFSQEEQIWSALALEILNQLNHKKYTLLSRLQFWLLLTLKRSNLGIAIGRVLLNLLPTILLVFSTFTHGSLISQAEITNHRPIEDR
jgi:TIR domain/KAP family P-loop domain